MNFLFKFVEGPRQDWWEGQSWADQLGDLLEAADHPRYRRVRSAKDAGRIVLVESVLRKDWRYLKILQSQPELRQHPYRCFTTSCEDDPLGVLPGCYAGISKDRFDSARHRATCYLRPPTNHLKTQAAARWDRVEPVHVLSFRGSTSHRVRSRLFAKQDEWKHLGPIRRTTRLWNHTDEDVSTYFEEMLASKFVLCPRGFAPSSHRLFEVMQLGRVPVILSDSWAPPAGPVWSHFSLSIPEDSIDDIPAVLDAHLHRAEEMGKVARAEWEQWFSPERCMVVAASAIEDILLSRPPGYREDISRIFFEALSRSVKILSRA